MTTNAPFIEKLSSFQPQIWQTVTQTVAEATGQTINFGSTLVNLQPTTELYAEMSAPRLVIQFGFSDLADHSQVLLLPQELLTEITTLVKGTAPETLDDNIVADVRQTIEAVVQGMCLAATAIKDSATVASDLTIRYQIFSFPPNLQKAENLVRTDVAVSGEGINGTAMWLMDPETAQLLLGLSPDDEVESPFAQAPEVTQQADGSFLTLSTNDESGLDILMDIPLEISVELGRVKMLVKDVVELGSGSIVEIDKAAGEPVDVLVNGRLVARGEVVVIEDNFGVRITEILNPQERLQKLNEVA